MQNIDNVNLEKVEICNFGTIGQEITCRNIFNPDLKKKHIGRNPRFDRVLLNH